MIRVIFDNGTPACLPRWAREEIRDLRLQVMHLKEDKMRLRREALIAQGVDPINATFQALGDA